MKKLILSLFIILITASCRTIYVKVECNCKSVESEPKSIITTVPSTFHPVPNDLFSDPFGITIRDNYYPVVTNTPITNLNMDKVYNIRYAPDFHIYSDSTFEINPVNIPYKK